MKPRNNARTPGLRSRAGTTVLEMVIAGAMSAVILGAIATAAISGQRSAAQNLAMADLETKARRALDRIAEEVVSSRSAALSPNPAGNFGTATLTYQKDVGYSAGAAVFGVNQRIRWVIEPRETRNNLDDDRDGLVDEGIVEFTRDVGAGTQRVVTLVRGVSEYLEDELPNGADDNANGLTDEQGLSFSLSGKTLTIRLSVQDIGSEGRVLTQTVETSVRIRN